jgi:hypothetical protein
MLRLVQRNYAFPMNCNTRFQLDEGTSPVEVNVHCQVFINSM